MKNKKKFLLEGKLVKFRNPSKEDAKGAWSEWFNNLENLIMLGRVPLPNTPNNKLLIWLKIKIILKELFS